MSSGFGGNESTDPAGRDWLLRCNGYRAYGPDGEYLGVVTDVVYDYSARWDRPKGVLIRAERGGRFEVRADDVEGASDGVLRLRARPLRVLPAGG